uniref:Uncharacterized protein n=1 Tax=Meloidogyne enterolobii TaxID=390850 RepID=A0A6V7XIE3_MELEN|nr:unnamed protein product [Meloidogyne enterolobii]
MLLWRTWLVRLLLNCSFGKGIIRLEDIIFNPIMILLLFKNTNPLISLDIMFMESGSCTVGCQFTSRMHPNFSEDMEKENASQNFPWLHYAEVAQLACRIFLPRKDESSCVQKLDFFFVSRFGYTNLMPMH